MARRTTRAWVAVAGTSVLVVGAVAAAALEAWALAAVGGALLLAACAFGLLDVRRRQQVVSAQLRALRTELQGQTEQVGELARSSSAGHDATLARLADSEQKLLRKLDAVSERMDERNRRTASIVTGVRKQVDLLDGHLLTDVQALDQLRARYSPRAALPRVAGWALSPSALLYLLETIESRGPGLVVECGSGTSTLWMSYALKESGGGRLIALEHDATYVEKTRQLLAEHGLSEWAEVRHAPLVSTPTPRGDFPWYDVDPSSLGPIDLLLVDGPPQATGRHARYPAMPVLHDTLVPGALVVLDDVMRKDEREAMSYWLEEHRDLDDLGRVVHGVQALAVTRN
ncbi:O-methyltransferase [Oerskovia flava]|uniref:O-methyltransferase n=1 Tax=Oerskovia flava TaxID=2986422 RepID=UPI00223FE20D|nr:class I SAM-dependent methyltransferase [Oerskovia sp. JB1-3-2]